jgi:hypothetical protein
MLRAVFTSWCQEIALKVEDGRAAVEELQAVALGIGRSDDPITRRAAQDIHAKQNTTQEPKGKFNRDIERLVVKSGRGRGKLYYTDTTPLVLYSYILYILDRTEAVTLTELRMTSFSLSTYKPRLKDRR